MLERVRKQTKEPKSSDEQIDEINDVLYELKSCRRDPRREFLLLLQTFVDKVIPEEHESAVAAMHSQVDSLVGRWSVQSVEIV